MAGKLYSVAIAIGAKVSATFKSETYSAAAALTRLGKEAKQFSALERSTERFAKFADTVAQAEKRYTTAAAALEQLKRAELAAGGATKESAKWTRAGERATKAAEVALGKARHAANTEAAALHLAGINTADLTREQHQLAFAIENTARRQKALTQAQEASNRLFGKRKKSDDPLFAKAGAQIGSVARDAVRLGGAAIAAGAGVFAIAKSTAEAGVDLDKTAIRLGTTTEALQLLRGAARKSDVDVDALDTGLGKLAINLGKVISLKKKGGGSGLVGNVGEIQMVAAKTGGGGKTAQADPFKHLKLSAKELAKLQPEEQVAKIADAINKLGTHAEKSAAVVQIFGKGGLALLPLIEKGSAGLEELFAQTRASGNLLSKETIENSKRFHLALLSTEGAIGSVKNTLGAALLPVVTDVLGKFTKFVAENRGQIKEWASSAAAWIQGKGVPALFKFGRDVVDLAVKIANAVEKVAGWVGGFKNLAIVVGALRLAPLAKTIAEIGFNVAKGAIALGKYVAATKALNAAESAGGGIGGAAAPTAAGKAMGLAANAAMLAGAAVVGYEIGLYIDDKLKISATTGAALG